MDFPSRGANKPNFDASKLLLLRNVTFPFFQFTFLPSCFFPARALRALGLLLADGAPTVGGGKTF